MKTRKQRVLNHNFLAYTARGDIEKMKNCLNRGADLYALYGNGKNEHALHLAAKYGRREALLFLLKEHTKNKNRFRKALNHPNVHGHTPLSLAAIYGHLDIIYILSNIKGIAINTADNLGYNALYLALKNRKIMGAYTLLLSKKLVVSSTDYESLWFFIIHHAINLTHTPQEEENSYMVYQEKLEAELFQLITELIHQSNLIIIRQVMKHLKDPGKTNSDAQPIYQSIIMILEEEIKTCCNLNGQIDSMISQNVLIPTIDGGYTINPEKAGETIFLN